jgi:hypothetical protein
MRGLPEFNFLFLQSVNLIGPLLKKKETMEAPQNKKFVFGRIEFLPFGPCM